MPRFIVKLKDKYLEWSTIVDAPVTYGMTLEEFRAYYREAYGSTSMDDLENRLARVESHGTSSQTREPVEEFVIGNRAGENEKCLTLEELYQVYCVDVPQGEAD